MMKLHLAACLWGAAISMAAPVDVYVASAGPKEKAGVYRFEIDDETGALTEPKQEVHLRSAGFLDLSPDQSIMVATTRSTPKEGKKDAAVASFNVSKDGSLKLNSTELAGGRGACHVKMDPTQSIVMISNYGDGSLASFGLKSDGSLTSAQTMIQHEGSSVNPKRQKGPRVHSAYPGPDNKYAYVADLGTDEVVIYEMDLAKGSLKRKGKADAPPGAGPRHMKFGGPDKRLYVLNELDMTVSVYKRLESGLLKQEQVVSTLAPEIDKAGFSCSEIRISRSQKFVYVANRDTKKVGRDRLSVFSLDQKTGQLKLIQNIAAGISIPRNINLDPSNRWLLVCGQNSDKVVSFKIGKDGKLASTPHSVSIPRPMCVVFRNK